MGMRVRLGPLSVSSRGRVGLRAGPVSVYGGGGRRRRSGGSNGSGEFWIALIGFALVVALVIFLVMWPLSLWGHALGLTPSWHQLMHRNKAWEHRHYPLVGLRYVGAAAALAGTVAGAITLLLALPRLQRRTALASDATSDAPALTSQPVILRPATTSGPAKPGREAPVDTGTPAMPLLEVPSRSARRPIRKSSGDNPEENLHPPADTQRVPQAGGTRYVKLKRMRNPPQ
jgi:hypothetical protein